ncbi:MAG: phosphotransferase system HPr-like phosphotransfer protein [Planctomycetota bacterium]|jgi:phosphotransferase system HPr-like phosphotransfer protein
MTKVQIQKVVPEHQFVELLQNHAESFFLLSNALTREQAGRWNKRHFLSLISETDKLEPFLDDYGARYNRTYANFTVLVASVRWFGKAGYSLAHHLGRLASYGAGQSLGDEDALDALKAAHQASVFTQDVATRLLAEIAEEARALGLKIPQDSMPDSHFPPVSVRVQLPRNVGQFEPQNEQQKIVEVASKYLQTCEMLNEMGVRDINDPGERASFLDRWCTEEKARVYQATVHNLQSAYDTHVRNTVLESEDARLPRLRGHCSAALHLLEAVTHLTHFIERHDADDRSEESKDRIHRLVDRESVQNVILNNLLVWANRYLQAGAQAAGELLPAYTNVTVLNVSLPPDVSLHARPVALIVSIVAHYGMPIEMEVGGQVESAASILKLLMLVGANPDEQQFVFRGAEEVLRDIELLFESGLGERGLDTLPIELDYLRNR